MRWVSSALAISCLCAVGCLPAAPSWSPDGKWIAYLTVAEVGNDRSLEPGWLLDRPAPVLAPSAVASPFPGKELRYRLWISKPEGGESVLLLESGDPISSPAWSPDGKALTVSRVQTQPSDGSKRLECLVVRGPSKRTVIFSEQVDRQRVDLSRLPEFTPAWSPDGGSIATAHADPSGIVVVKIATRQVLAIVEKGLLPSWSPDGSRLAYVKHGESDTVGVIDVKKGQPRHLLDVGKGDQAPVWTRDGQSLILSARHSRAVGGQQPVVGEDAVLLRVQVDNGQIEPVKALTSERPSTKDAGSTFVTFAMDKEAENLLCSISSLDAPSYVTWFRPREGSTFRKFPVVDLSLPIGGISLSPSGRMLALRMGRPEQHLSPVLYDLEKNTASILAPDEASRQGWINVLGTTVQALVNLSRDGLAKRQPKLVSPSPIPLPGEIDENSEVAFRLRRLARLGKAIVDDSGKDAPLPASIGVATAEAGMLFEYLSGDYTAALASISRLEDASGSPERNLALLSLRAQTNLASGDLEGFREAFALLESVERPSRQAIEYQGGVARLVPAPRQRALYSSPLRHSLTVMESEEQDEQPGSDAKTPAILQLRPEPFRFPSPFDPPGLPFQP